MKVRQEKAPQYGTAATLMSPRENQSSRLERKSSASRLGVVKATTQKEVKIATETKTKLSQQTLRSGFNV